MSFLVEFQLIVFENKRTLMKKAVLYTAILMHCKARHGLRDLFITKQGNGSKMI